MESRLRTHTVRNHEIQQFTNVSEKCFAIVESRTGDELNELFRQEQIRRMLLCLFWKRQQVFIILIQVDLP
jgi:hypothetical protein